MKPLALALLSALVLAPAALRAQPESDAAKRLAEMKEKYGKGGQRPEGAEAASGAEAPKEAAPPRSGSVIAGTPGMPALYARYAKGPDGYTLKQLVQNMEWTERNLSGLLDYIHPYKEGVAAPEGADAEAALKSLAVESKAAAELAADFDAALAKGVQRKPLDPHRISGAMYYASRASYAYRNPTQAQLLQRLASAQANVLGHGASLLEYKQENPPKAEEEAKVEGWLADARKDLAAAAQAIRVARDR
jgi:hypothetical protein